MKKFYYNLLSNRHYTTSLEKLKKLEKHLITPRARFAIPFIFKGSGFFKSINCMQNQSEIENLFHLICDQKPKRVLEIGTAKGGALYLWSQAASSDATIVSVDLPEGEFGGGYPVCRIPFYQSFVKQEQKLHLIRADSHAQSTVDDVKRIFDGPIDFLFIDGDHTYEGVKQDFEKYGPLVRNGGLIGFHDILPRPDIPEIEVDRYWKEIKQKYGTETFELIGEEGTGRKIGCGMLKVTR